MASAEHLINLNQSELLGGFSTPSILAELITALEGTKNLRASELATTLRKRSTQLAHCPRPTHLEWG